MTRFIAAIPAVLLVALLALLSASSFTRSPARAAEGHSYSIQGDSLSVMARTYFKTSLKGWQQTSFSAKVGRQYWDGQKYLKKQKLGEVVVFALGTNSWQSSRSAFRSAIRSLLRDLKSQRCLVMATIYDQKPIESFNSVIRSEARKAGSGRMQVADWASLVTEGKVRLSDGVHPASGSGARSFARVIASAAKRCA